MCARAVCIYFVAALGLAWLVRVFALAPLADAAWLDLCLCLHSLVSSMRLGLCLGLHSLCLVDVEDVLVG